MGKRRTVDFSDKIEPLYKKYISTYGVQNTCSLGIILIHRLTPHDREHLMGMVAADTSLEKIYLFLKTRK